MKKIILSTTLLASTILVGCSAIDEKGDYKNSFVGQKKADLIKAIGEPKYSIDSTFDDQYASRTIVYATTDPSLGCVESYKIETQTQTVLEYKCR